MIYGLCVFKNKLDLVEKVLSTGIWRLADFSNNVDNYYSEKLQEMKAGDKVFMYTAPKDVAIKDSPFAQFLDSDRYDFNKTVTDVKSLSIGKIISVDSDSLEIKVDWKEDYQTMRWHRIFRQRPIWPIDSSKGKWLELLKTVFDNKPFDYKWWSENGKWSDKLISTAKENKNLVDSEPLFRKWLSKRVQTNSAVDGYTKALNGKNQVYKDFREQNGFDSNMFKETDISKIDAFYKRLIREGDLSDWNRSNDNSRLSAAIAFCNILSLFSSRDLLISKIKIPNSSPPSLNT